MQLNKFYMDDFLDFFGNLDETITTGHGVKPFLMYFNISITFNLATFTSSNRITLKNLSYESLSSKVVNLDLEELLTESGSSKVGRGNRYASVQILKQSHAINKKGCFQCSRFNF